MHVAGKAVMLESLPDGSEVAESSTGVGTSEPARVSNLDLAANAGGLPNQGQLLQQC